MCGDCCHNLAVNVILTKKIEEVFKLFKADAASNLDVPLVVLHHHTLAGDDLGEPEYEDDDLDNDVGGDGAPERRLDGGVAVEEVVGPGHGRYPRLELVRGQLVAVVDVDQVPHLPEHGILFLWLLHFDIDNGSPLDQDHISYIDLCGQAEAILGGDNSTNS